jgi:hypothetical protein
MQSEETILKWMREHVDEYTGHDGANYYVGDNALAFGAASELRDMKGVAIPDLYYMLARQVAVEQETKKNG